MLRGLVVCVSLALPTAAWSQAAGTSLRFFGNGVDDIDRVKIRVDDPADGDPGPPADIGAADFTLEFWLRAAAADNTAPAVSCGANINWIYGNIVFDRDRYNQDRKFGLSLAAGRPVWGVSGDGTGDRTICGATSVLDGQWHHVAVQRRRADGFLWLFVDGLLQSQANGPDGDVSYPDAGVPGDYCGGPCVDSDPFLVIGAEKHDAGMRFPSFAGFVDEVRLSGIVRYTANFVPPAQPFVSDAATVALYHFDEGGGDGVYDASGAPTGPSNGVRRLGGAPAGPLWSTSTPFPAPSVAPGNVSALRLGRAASDPSMLALAWGPSCATPAVDYALYEGSLGAWYGHLPLACSTGGATSATVTPSAGDRYYIVVPFAAGVEGAYGTTSAGAQRPRSPGPCAALQNLSTCN